MHRLMVTAAAIPLSLSLLASQAAAEGALDGSTTGAEPATSSPALRVDAGLFSPIGSLGLVYSRPVHPVAAVELGAGIGFSGVQLSAMAKLRAGSERTRFTPGIGVSFGLPLLGASAVHEDHPMGGVDDEMRGPSVTMAWLDVDVLGVEHRTRAGVVLSASAGLTVALTEGHWDAIDLGDNIQPFTPLPQLRLGVGKAF